MAHGSNQPPEASLAARHSRNTSANSGGIWPSAASPRRNRLTGLAGSLNYYPWFVYEFWRFVHVQQEVGKLAQTAIEFPPMQKGASFNQEAVKEQIEKAAQSRAGK